MSGGKKAAKVDKYRDCVLPRLGEILDWARAGADLKEIATKLGVGYTTLRSWVKKGGEGEERYISLAVVLAAGQKEPNNDVEAALYRRAKGYTVQETTEEIRKNADGEVTGTVTKNVTKEIPPDPTSILFLLRNRMPEKWRKDPEMSQAQEERETGVIELAPVMPGEEEKANG